MRPSDFKKHIFDKNLIQDVLDKLGCHGIREYNKEFRCGLPNIENATRLSVRKDENISIRAYLSDDKVLNGDIFTLVSHIKNFTFYNSIKYLHEILGMQYTYQSNVEDKKEECDLLDVFTNVIKSKRRYDVADLEVYHDEIIGEYIPLVHIDWVREGILPKTAERFNIGYSVNSQRITIPHRYWCGSDNDYLGVFGRTTVKGYDILGIPKYYGIKPYPKGMNVYGLNENYNSIQECGYCAVFESEKSVLKRHSLGDGSGTAICSHDMTDEQVKILISLNVEIIIIMDEGVSLNHIRGMCEKFYGIRKISYVFDRHGILNKKESPADRHSKIYNHMIKYRAQYDEKEREEYQKWLENRTKK